MEQTSFAQLCDRSALSTNRHKSLHPLLFPLKVGMTQNELALHVVTDEVHDSLSRASLQQGIECTRQVSQYLMVQTSLTSSTDGRVQQTLRNECLHGWPLSLQSGPF